MAGKEPSSDVGLTMGFVGFFLLVKNTTSLCLIRVYGIQIQNIFFQLNFLVLSTCLIFGMYA